METHKQQNQRIEGKQIARQQGAPDHGIEEDIGRHDDIKNGLVRRRDARPRGSVPFPQGQQEHRPQHAQHGHEHVHMRGELQDAMRQGQQDAQRRERGGRVVTQEFRIAQEIPGAVAIVGIPAQQGDDRGKQDQSRAEVGASV